MSCLAWYCAIHILHWPLLSLQVGHFPQPSPLQNHISGISDIYPCLLCDRFHVNFAGIWFCLSVMAAGTQTMSTEQARTFSCLNCMKAKVCMIIAYLRWGLTYLPCIFVFSTNITVHLEDAIVILRTSNEVSFLYGIP